MFLNDSFFSGGLLCDKDLQNLKNWKPAPGLDKKNKKYLTAQGERDLFSIGERLRTKFPELLVASASNKYKVMTIGFL